MEKFLVLKAYLLNKCKESYILDRDELQGSIPIEKEKYYKIFDFLEKHANLITSESLGE